MKKDRRSFIRTGMVGGLSLAGMACSSSAQEETMQGPIVVATWDHGVQSNAVSWPILAGGGSSLDAVEQGVRVVESDPNGTTVGLGGTPDREGKVTLDACIMNHDSQCGAVAFLQDIEHPISVARKVMEETPHVMLAGAGAYQFAREQGFPKRKLLTEKGEADWKEWLKTSQYKPKVNVENHDTISALALDASGQLAGACTTSGMAYKMHGRVGDSPIIGASLFVDGDVGAACATGVGEAIIRVAGSALVVELMRQGLSPEEACAAAVQRIADKHKSVEDLQVGFIALSKNGVVGAASMYPGFTMAVQSATRSDLVNAPSLKG
ncbi:MAG: N(4)-(beta-N-acetylglucosaminyl)-L-asparaginase [Saprospiraceae bacterium]|nr:N(4)-(beta-N-acetylglucosaminyl)-L-asparaginase [Saprospiraceae bacterium]